MECGLLVISLSGVILHVFQLLEQHSYRLWKGKGSGMVISGVKVPILNENV